MKENPYIGMDESANRIAFLIAGFIKRTLTENEHDELDTWVNESDHNMQLFEELTNENNISANLHWLNEVNATDKFKELQNKGAFQISSSKRSSIKWWVAAASVIFAIGLFYFSNKLSNNAASDEQLAANTLEFLKPGGNKATLSLPDGQQINLADASVGLLQEAVGAAIQKTADGVIVYDNKAAKTNNENFHILSTPIGGQFEVKLHDGTKVWLNAASSLKFPAAFKGNERKVYVQGEAYFEVAKNEKMPFKVSFSDSTTVVVTGTHFNINAYSNEPIQQVTLMEGGVKVVNNSGVEFLEPGTQAVVKNNLISKEKVDDVQEIIGWKNGMFVFHDASLPSIMKQIERWYDAKVIFKTNGKQLFNATISRNESLSKFLKLLELNGFVHFEVNNKTIYVLP